jgi:hypothetical protein
LGSLGIENRKPKIENWKLKINSLFPSRQQLPKKIKINFFIFKKKISDAGLHPRGLVVASAQTRFLPRRRTVKTRPRIEPRPRGKLGRAQTSGR